MDNALKKSDISKRILETRKETEELKAQLQNLIDSGFNSSLEYKAKTHSHLDKENIKESENKVQIIKSYDAKHSQHVTKPSSSRINLPERLDAKPEIEETNCKKTKHYDVHKTREYIKKQREKRLEQHKLQNEEKKKAELQKQKLQELHKKSLELVTKNVQAKRERSKSRERTDFVRPIKEVPGNRSASQERAINRNRPKVSEKLDRRGKSVERTKNLPVENFEPKNTNLLYPPLPNYMSRSQERKTRTSNSPTSRNKIVIISGNSSDRNSESPHFNHKDEGKSLKPKNLFSSPKDSNTLYPPPNYQLYKTQMQTNESSIDEGKINATNQNSPNVFHKTTVVSGNNTSRKVESRKLDIDSKQELVKPKDMEVSHLTDGKCSLETESNNNFSCVNNMLNYKKTQNRNGSNIVSQSDNINKSRNNNNLAEIAVGTDNLEKFTKETQTNEPKPEFPAWLQESKVRSDPFNFINTVTRKLQCRMNSPTTYVDVGVQSSLAQDNSKPNTQTSKIKEVLKSLQPSLQQSARSSKKSDLKSFISHKCLNLDQKTIDNIELIPKHFSSRHLTSSKNTDSESESDTSKNIPEISSESGTSLKKNAQSVKQNGTIGLDVEKISSLRLRSHNIDKDTHTIQSEEIQTEITLNPYSTVVGDKKSQHKINSDNPSNTKRSVSKIVENEQYTSDFQSNTRSESIHSNLTQTKMSKNVNYENLMDPHIMLYSERHSNNIPKSSEKHSSNTTNNSDEEKFVASRNITQNITIRNNRSEKNMPHTPIQSIDSKDVSGSQKTKSNDRWIETETQRDRSKPGKNISHTSIQSIDSKDVSGSQKTNSNDRWIETETQRDRSKTGKNISHTSIQSIDSRDISRSQKKKSNDRSIETETQKDRIEESQKSDSVKSIKTSTGSADKYKSLYSDFDPSATISEMMSKSDSNLHYINTRRGSQISSENSKFTNILPLKEPTLSLVVANGKVDKDEDRSKLLKKISLKSDANKFTDQTNTNEIHLKFEAEIHLLNDFNESLRQFSEVEKAFNSLKSKNDVTGAANKILHNRDTQTSLVTKSSSTSTKVTENSVSDDKSELSSINFSRGFLIDPDTSALNVDTTVSKLDDTNNAEDFLNLHINSDLSNFENLQSNNFAGMTLRMFEQLIKDEDVRLENLKTILKIREQALLDRTKGELAWLEIQRKHLRETGKLHEASLIKKKQRGILVNHQKERHEMQRLKQMQKAASIERKIILKEQRNLIKHQLSTDKMLSKIKVNTPRERRLSGPLKVIQSHTESIRSETSFSRRSSSEKEKETYSMMSHTQSIVSMVSEISGEEGIQTDGAARAESTDLAIKLPSEACGVPISQMKRTLLIREAALQKRRKAALELLQWHRKLLEEEKRITELESTASTIISQIPSNAPDVAEKYQFKGRQLNQLWFNLTGCKQKKFSENKIYPMSQIALERFCKSAREYSTKTKPSKRASDSEISDYCVGRTDDSLSENIPLRKVSAESQRNSNRNANDYASDFDVESLQDIVDDAGDMDVVDKSINRLIDDFSRIQEDISSLGIRQSLKSDADEESIRSEKTDSEVEVSVIETAKTSRENFEGADESSKRHDEMPDLVSSSEVPSLVENRELGRSILEENALNNLNASKEILEELSYLESRIDEDISDERKSVLEDIQIVNKAKDNLSKTEEILSRLSHSENKHSIISSEGNLRPLASEAEITLDENSGAESGDIILDLQPLDDTISKEISSAPEQLSIDEKSAITKDREIDEVTEDKDEENVLLSVGKIDLKSGISEEPRTEKSEGVRISDMTDEIIKSTDEDNELIVEEVRLDSEVVSVKSTPTEGLSVKVTEGVKISDVTDEINKSTDEDNESVLEEVRLDSEFVPTKSTPTEELSVKVNEGVKISDVTDEINKSTDENNELILEEVCLDSEVVSAKSTPTEELSVKVTEGVKISDVTDEINKSTDEDSELILEEDHLDSEVVPTKSTLTEELSVRGTEGVNLKDVTEAIKETSEEIYEDSAIPDKSESEKEENKSSVVEEKLVQFEEASSEAVVGSPHEDEDVTRGEEEKSHSVEISEIVESLKEIEGEEGLSTDKHPESDGYTKPLEEDVTEIRDKLSYSFRTDEDYRKNDVEEELTEDSTSEDVELVTESSRKEVEETSGSKPSEATVTEKISLEKSVVMPDKSEAVENEKIEDVSRGTVPDIVPSTVEEMDRSEMSSFGENITALLSKEDINSFEEKELDSLSSSTTGSQSSVINEKDERSSSEKTKDSVSEEKSPRSEAVDVKKRVSEIMADANQGSRGDKSPKLQDFYTTTYDLVSPANSPELGSPTEEHKYMTAKSIFGTEAEELLRKQLAIEQEIKQITEQQQKEQLPYLFVREIPNKPPPPYTPPSSIPSTNVISIIPTSEEIENITKYSAKILHKAYLSNNLDNISISENTLSLISKDITKESYKFVFDLCKEISKDHYKQFEKEECLAWLQVKKNPRLAVIKPLDVTCLEKHMNRKLKELFGYEKPMRRENTIIKWSRKKRDHVDEILVMESQAEETQWTNYDKDELLVMNEVTNEIMNMLLKETGEVFNKILSKQTFQ